VAAVDQTHRQQPNSPTHPGASRPAVDDHGRAVTASRQAAAWYRHAQRSADLRRAGAALRLAVATDPGFALAIADLDAIIGATPRLTTGRQMNWERHHIEVVRSAGTRNFERAADLLRELLAAVGCDPLAMRIVIDLAKRTGKERELDDLSRQTPGCHPAWPSRP
jgi:hypothetical protein